MLSRMIKMSSIVVTLFILLLTMQYVSVFQQRTPFDTDSQFVLNLSESRIEKIELVKKLNELSKKNDVTLLKISVDVNEYKNKQDIILFGNNKQKFTNPVVINGKIKWLDNDFYGNLIMSNSIDDRLLTGVYAFSNSETFKSDLKKFTAENDIGIEFYDKTSALKTLYAFFALNGTGNSVLVTFLLLTSTIIIWFVVNSKSRAIRYLEGKTKLNINIADTLEVIKKICMGVSVGLLVFSVWVGVTKGVSQIWLLALPFIQSLIIFILAIALLTFIFSLAVSPNTKHISERKIPLRGFINLARIHRYIAIFIALIVVPTTMNAAIITHKIFNEYALWNNTNMIRLSFSELDELVKNDMLSETYEFFKTLADDDNLSISYVLDNAIELNKDELGGYDHIIITDKAWLKNMDVGIEKKGKNGTLNKIKYENIHGKLKTFLEGQMPILTQSREMKPKGIEFYNFNGDVFFALPPNVGVGAETIRAKNPFVIVADKPVETFKIDGFILYAASSGNVVFNDMRKLKDVIEKSSIKPYISSVDNVSEVALSTAQKFRKQSMTYFMACIIIGVVILFSGILSGKLWAVSNKKKIFTLHTFGQTYGDIIAPLLKIEMVKVFASIIIGGIFAYIVNRVSVQILLAVMLMLLLLQIISELFAYKYFSKQAFKEMIRRN